MGSRSGLAAASEIERSQRQALVLKLRTQGMGAASIQRALAEDHGIQVGLATVRTDMRRALAELAEETREDTQVLRALEVERLNMAAAAIAPRVRAGDLQAVDRWTRLSEARSKLLGLNAPIEVQVTQRVNSEMGMLVDFLQRKLSPEAFEELQAAMAQLETDTESDAVEVEVEAVQAIARNAIAAGDDPDDDYDDYDDDDEFDDCDDD